MPRYVAVTSRPRWHWAGLLLVWLTAVALWTLAAARGIGEPPLNLLPYGIAQMGVAGVLAIADVVGADRTAFGRLGPRYLRFR